MLNKIIYLLTAIMTWLFLPLAIIVVAAVAAYDYVADCIVYERDKYEN